MKIQKDPIYTISTIRSPGFSHIRCIGFFHELDVAIKAVENNDMDMNEDGYYHYALIEKVGPGFYNLAYLTIEDHEIWFKWHNIRGYQRCEKPDHYKRTVCFGIG